MSRPLESFSASSGWPNQPRTAHGAIYPPRRPQDRNNFINLNTNQRSSHRPRPTAVELLGDSKLHYPSTRTYGIDQGGFQEPETGLYLFTHATNPPQLPHRESYSDNSHRTTDEMKRIWKKCDERDKVDNDIEREERKARRQAQREAAWAAEDARKEREERGRMIRDAVSGVPRVQAANIPGPSSSRMRLLPSTAEGRWGSSWRMP
jgi:hypothetical protein